MKRVLRENAATCFGREHQFDAVDSPRSFRNRVPLSEYEDLKPYVERITDGEQHVLTRRLVPMLEPSSGTTSATKLIPYTAGLRREFVEGINTWVWHLLSAYPGIRRGTLYLAVSPASGFSTAATSRVPIGFGDDTAYLTGLQQGLVSRLLSIPSELCALSDLRTLQYLTRLLLLADEHLSFISVWSPTFLNVILDDLGQWADRTVSNIAEGRAHPPSPIPPEVIRAVERRLQQRRSRADELRRIFAAWQSGDLDNPWPYIWPNLCLVSCWADGWSRDPARHLMTQLSHAQMQPKGLLATEACVSIPLTTEGVTNHVLAACSHYFEFENQDTGEVVNAWDLRNDATYGVIVTTSGGLYRYRLHDLVRVRAWRGQLPVLSFVGRSDRTSDLSGEKLNAVHATRVVNNALHRYAIRSDTYFLVPDASPTRGCYKLYLHLLDSDINRLPDLQKLVEAGLQENYHYRHCRNLGQLDAVALVPMHADERDRYLGWKSARNSISTVKPGGIEDPSATLILYP